MADAISAADADENMILRLKSCDGKICEVKADIASYMKYVKNMTEDVQVENGMEIPMGEVEGEVLQKVVDFCQFLQDVENMKFTAAECDEFENSFITVDMPLLFKMILAANFLDIQPMFDLTCKTVANMIKGKSPEEINRTFAIQE